MRNPWMAKRNKGTIRYTNMSFATATVDLPIKFRMTSTVNTGATTLYRAIMDDEGDLEWVSAYVIKIGQKEMNLVLDPVYSIPMNDYVFTVN